MPTTCMLAASSCQVIAVSTIAACQYDQLQNLADDARLKWTGKGRDGAQLATPRANRKQPGDVRCGPSRGERTTHYAHTHLFSLDSHHATPKGGSRASIHAQARPLEIPPAGQSGGSSTASLHRGSVHRVSELKCGLAEQKNSQEIPNWLVSATCGELH